MNGSATRRSLNKKSSPEPPTNGHHSPEKMSKKKSPSLTNAHFMNWSSADIFGMPRHHPVPCLFAGTLLMFMAVEYTLRMIPANAPPFDLGFVATQGLHRLLSARPALNTLLAGLNTVIKLNLINLICSITTYYVVELRLCACLFAFYVWSMCFACHANMGCIDD